MMYEFLILFRYYIGVWYEVKKLLAKTLLHFPYVKGKFIFSRDFNAVRKMIDFLVLIKSLIKVSFAVATGPKDVPVVGLGMLEVVCFQNAANELRIAIKNFVKKF